MQTINIRNYVRSLTRINLTTIAAAAANVVNTAPILFVLSLLSLHVIVYGPSPL